MGGKKKKKGAKGGPGKSEASSSAISQGAQAAKAASAVEALSLEERPSETASASARDRPPEELERPKDGQPPERTRVHREAVAEKEPGRTAIGALPMSQSAPPSHAREPAGVMSPERYGTGPASGRGGPAGRGRGRGRGREDAGRPGVVSPPPPFPSLAEPKVSLPQAAQLHPVTEPTVIQKPQPPSFEKQQQQYFPPSSGVRPKVQPQPTEAPLFPPPSEEQKRQPPSFQRQQPQYFPPSSDVRPKVQPQPTEAPPVRPPSEKQKRQPLASSSTSPLKQVQPQQLSKEPLKAPSPPSTGKQIEPIRRPDKGGTDGREIALRANFFKMNVNPDVMIYHYDIAIKPELKSKAKVRQLINAFVKENPNIMKGLYPVFDGRKNLYTHRRLPIRDKAEFDVKMPDDREGAAPLKVTVQLANEISLYSFVEFINGRLREFPQESIQALDIVCREMPTNRHIPLNQYFFTNPVEDIGPGLEIWNGYYQSVRPAWKVTMLNVDSSVRVFHKGQNVIALLQEVLNTRVDIKTSLHRTQHCAFENHIKGLAVEINTGEYPMLIKRTYKIIGLSEKPCSQQKFPMSQPDGSERPCIVADYYRDTYNLNLRYLNLPCLQAQPKEKHRYIPMEICVVKKGQQLRKLGDELTSQLIRYSAVPAPNRERDIMDLMRNSKFDQDPYMKSFGLSISKEMTEFNGRVLTAPRIEYKNSSDAQVKDGSWNMQSFKFYIGESVGKMALMCFDRYTKEQELSIFLTELHRAAVSTGMSLPSPDQVLIEYGNTARDVENLIVSLQNKLGVDLRLILAVLPPKKNDIYGEIKRVGDLVVGVPTQCVLQKNVRFCKVQTMVNICLKINAKLGGTNGVIKRVEFSEIMSTPVIIMGADVTHPAAGDENKPSIAAVTGSYDQAAFKYTARIRMQKHRQEVIDDLKNITMELLRNFRAKTTKGPDRIIFFRDGVSEGQFKEVLATELQAIQQACYSLSPTYKPKITFIVVQKRHHTRLFCKYSKDVVGKSRNVPAGTTVDTDITHPIEFDFYLCSHQGIQGTSKPAHYYVLYDDSNFSSDKIQKLTYQLCHVYSRCTRSVSIPAPAYYAHHCAFRGRYYYDRFLERGTIPSSEQLGAEVLQRVNNDCNLKASYPGMFFA